MPGTPMNVVGAALRGASLVLRFALVTVVARWYSLEDLGTFGLFQAIAVIGTQVLGLELYTHTQRGLVTASPERRSELLWSQVRFHVAGYLLVVPIAVIGASAIAFSPVALACLAAVLVTGHIAAELVRVLIATSSPRAAYVVQFGANAMWVIPVLALSSTVRDIDVIFVVWAVASTVTSVLGWMYLRRAGIVTGGFSLGNWATVRDGLRAARPFFVMAVCLRAMEYSDRFFLQAMYGEATVGTYTFFSRLASAVHDLITAGVYSAMFPLMIAAPTKGPEEWRAVRTQYLRRLLIALAILLPCAAVSAQVLLAIVNRPELHDNLPVFHVLLGSAAATSLGTYSFFLLYADRRDWLLALSALATLALNGGLNAALVPPLGMLGAAIASLASLVVLGGARWMLGKNAQASRRPS